jgi:iduronate 2-sulfatase
MMPSTFSPRSPRPCVMRCRFSPRGVKTLRMLVNSFVLAAGLFTSMPQPAHSADPLPHQFRVWATSCSHVPADIRKGRESLARAIRQSEGLVENAPAFEWDIMVDAGDLSAHQSPPGDRDGKELQRQYRAMTKHRREQVYNVPGNHDAPYYDHGPGSWFRKWGDPLGENTQFSGVDPQRRPFPVEGTWERYRFFSGNVLFLMLADRNDAPTPVGRGHSRDGQSGGFHAGAVTRETFNWWKQQVLNNQDKIIVTMHHHVLRDTTVASGYGEGHPRYHGKSGGGEGSSYLYYLIENDDPKDFRFTKDAHVFEDFLDEFHIQHGRGAIDLWIGGHTHVKGPDDHFGAKTISESRWGVLFLQVAALTQHHAGSHSLSRVLTFTPGSDQIKADVYLHEATYQNNPIGWYVPASKTFPLRHTFVAPAPIKSMSPFPRSTEIFDEPYVAPKKLNIRGKKPATSAAKLKGEPSPQNSNPPATVAVPSVPIVTNAAQRPNILFIGVDDLRPELGCYGASHISSPNIDKLATAGVVFERAYCQWAVCMPSRASLLSGLRPDSFGGQANRFREAVPDVVTLPQHFKNHGYFSQSFGKIYHGSWATAYVGNSFQDPVSWSAPRFASSPRYYFTVEGVRVARQVFYESNDKFLSKVKKNPHDADQWTQHFVRGLATEAPDVSDDLPGDGQVAVAALKKLREIHADPQPFFLAVGFMKPHLPFVAPRRYWDLYDSEKIPPVDVPRRPDGAPSFAVQTGAGEVNQYVNKSQGLVSPQRTRHLRHGYAACVSYVDAQIGRLLDELDVLGIRDQTIVVLWSDHGYKLGDFGAWAKHTNFELDTRVPLIISGPGLPQGQRSRAIVELVDLHPTLSELAGLPIHPGAEGESFAINVRSPEQAGQDVALSQFPKAGLMGYTIRTATHRYTEWRRTKGPNKGVAARELYEYGPDNIERVNIADRPEFQAIQQSLQQRLSAIVASAK